MNTTKASCGHSVVAVGAPGSAARKQCEALTCFDCSASDHAAHRLASGECQRHVDQYAKERAGCDECAREARNRESRRANFARAAMNGMISSGRGDIFQTARDAVRFADAIIAELDKPKAN